MDDQRFDNLTRRLAAAGSRRALLKGFVGGLAGLLAARPDTNAAAQASRKPNGASCTRATDCTSLKCVDGVCCNATCTGQCEACNLPGLAGTCSPVTGTPVGARPACPGQGACRSTCDGVNRQNCAFPGSAVSCGASTCAGGVQTTFVCGGNGACTPATTPCGLFTCDAGGTACLTTCTASSDCLGAAFCADGICQGDRPLGEACSAPDQCQSGFCVDGVCCNTDCGGVCLACNVAGNLGFCTEEADGASCAGGVCCDGDCVNITSDAEHCGACDAACGANQQCAASVCVCVPGAVPCGTGCVAGCPQGEVLDPTSCTCVCPAGTTECGGNCVAVCLPGQSLDANCLCVGACKAVDDLCSGESPAGDAECCSGVCGCAGTHCSCRTADCAPRGGSCQDGGTSRCCTDFCQVFANPTVCLCVVGEVPCGGTCVSDDCPSGQAFNPSTCQCEPATCVEPGDLCTLEGLPCCEDVDTCGANGICCTRILEVCDPANDHCCRGFGGEGGCVAFDGGHVCCGISDVSLCAPGCATDAPCASCCGGLCGANGRCAACRAGTIFCDGACVSTDCPADRSFDDSTCQCECVPDRAPCGDVCCLPGQSCISPPIGDPICFGFCTAQSVGELCSGETPAGDAECCSGVCGCNSTGAICTCRNADCAPPAGSCEGESHPGCCSGVCQAGNPDVCSCPVGSVLCGGTCVSDDCPSGEAFNPSTCLCTACPAGTIVCDEACVSTDCLPGSTFDDSTCQCECAPGRLSCGDVCCQPGQSCFDPPVGNQVCFGFCTAQAVGEPCSGETLAGNAECCSGVCGCNDNGIICTCREEQCIAPAQSCVDNSECCAGVCMTDVQTCSCRSVQVPCGGQCLPFCGSGQAYNQSTCECEAV